MMRVVEVPMGTTGVAGYAIDVEEREQARANLTRFVRAQRDMLDRLSAGVAQFNREHGLIFFNQPFARLFSLKPDFLRSEEHTSELQSLMRISYAVFCLKKKTIQHSKNDRMNLLSKNTKPLRI